MKTVCIVTIALFGSLLTGCSKGDNNSNNDNNTILNNQNNGEGVGPCTAEVRTYGHEDSELPNFQVGSEEAGENCELGGQQLQFGTDENEDNKLSAAEITETEVVCDTRFPTAGQKRFYRLDDTYCSTIDSVLKDVEEGDDFPTAKVVLSPHAGWQFSGIATATAFSRVEIPDLVIILANNHFDNGAPYAVYDAGAWALPTGDVPVDEEIAAQLINDVDLLVADRAAHSTEHSTEMQVMWLHRFNPDVRVVPIAFDNTNDVEELITIANEIAASLKTIDEPYLVVTTTDLTHFDPKDVAKEQDDQMIAEMLELDAEGLHALVSPQRGVMSMCGLEPSVVGIQVAKELGATDATKVMQLDSSEQTGNEDNVVGYVSIVFH